VATQAEHFDVPPDQLLQLLQRLITLSREKRPPPLQQLTTLLGPGDYSLLAQPPASRPFSASVLLGHSIPFIHTTAVEATSYGAAPRAQCHAQCMLTDFFVCFDWRWVQRTYFVSERWDCDCRPSFGPCLMFTSTFIRYLTPHHGCTRPTACTV
jgi:hypothetical protein